MGLYLWGWLLFSKLVLFTAFNSNCFLCLLLNIFLRFCILRYKNLCIFAGRASAFLFYFGCVILSSGDDAVFFVQIATESISILRVFHLKGHVWVLAGKQVGDQQNQVDQNQYWYHSFQVFLGPHNHAIFLCVFKDSQDRWQGGLFFWQIKLFLIVKLLKVVHHYRNIIYIY